MEKEERKISELKSRVQNVEAVSNVYINNCLVLLAEFFLKNGDFTLIYPYVLDLFSHMQKNDNLSDLNLKMMKFHAIIEQSKSTKEMNEQIRSGFIELDQKITGGKYWTKKLESDES